MGFTLTTYESPLPAMGAGPREDSVGVLTAAPGGAPRGRHAVVRVVRVGP